MALCVLSPLKQLDDSRMCFIGESTVHTTVDSMFMYETINSIYHTVQAKSQHLELKKNILMLA